MNFSHIFWLLPSPVACGNCFEIMCVKNDAYNLQVIHTAFHNPWMMPHLGFAGCTRYCTNCRMWLTGMEQPTYRFKEPKRKRRHKWLDLSATELPFPVAIASVLGLPASNGQWNYFTGHLVGNSVFVDDNDSSQSLYQMVLTSTVLFGLHSSLNSVCQ